MRRWRSTSNGAASCSSIWAGASTRAREGRELDGEGQRVEPSDELAQLGDRGLVPAAHHAGVFGALHEQTHGVLDGQRLDEHPLLVLQAEAHARRDEEGRTPPAREQLAQGRDHLLGVVEHEQLPLRTERVLHPLRAVGPASHAQHARDDVHHVRNRARFGQIAEPHRVEVRGGEQPELDREPRLAHPARSDQGDQATAGGQAPPHVGQQAVSAQEARGAGHEVGARRRAGDRCRLRVLGEQVADPRHRLDPAGGRRIGLDLPA